MPDLDRMEEALHRIVQWAEAYSARHLLRAHWKAARAALQAAGISPDAVSAMCMRHVIEGVGKVAKEALECSRGS